MVLANILVLLMLYLLSCMIILFSYLTAGTLAEASGQDQRKDEGFARTHTPVQQGFSAFNISTVVLFSGMTALDTGREILVLVYELQSDKASMLDEAIEYLKSLQLQVQVDSPVFHFSDMALNYEILLLH